MLSLTVFEGLDVARAFGAVQVTYGQALAESVSAFRWRWSDPQRAARVAMETAAGGQG